MGPKGKDHTLLFAVELLRFDELSCNLDVLIDQVSLMPVLLELIRALRIPVLFITTVHRGFAIVKVKPVTGDLWSWNLRLADATTFVGIKVEEVMGLIRGAIERDEKS